MHDDYRCLRVQVVVERAMSGTTPGKGIDLGDRVGAVGLCGSPGDTPQWIQLSVHSRVEVELFSARDQDGTRESLGEVLLEAMLANVMPCEDHRSLVRLRRTLIM